MNEIKLLSSLLPGHPDFLLILLNIRKKYDIPEISPEDDGITEIFLADNQIDWDAVRQGIEDEIRAIPIRKYQRTDSTPNIDKPTSAGQIC